MTNSRARDEQLEKQFRDDGYVILRNFLEPEVLDGVRLEMEGLVQAHAERIYPHEASLAGGSEFQTRLYNLYRDRLDESPRLFRRELHLAGMYPLLFHSGLLDVV